LAGAAFAGAAFLAGAAFVAAGFFAVAISFSLNNLQRALHASLACQVIHGVGSDPSTMNGGPQPSS
jgi:hypothetical protein